jgi:hypothetical protein
LEFKLKILSNKDMSKFFNDNDISTVLLNTSNIDEIFTDDLELNNDVVSMLKNIVLGFYIEDTLSFVTYRHNLDKNTLCLSYDNDYLINSEVINGIPKYILLCFLSTISKPYNQLEI